MRVIVHEVPVSDIDVSESNTRKNLEDGQHDSSIDDLARSISQQGLLSPITIAPKPDGKYEVIAGQRRLLACRQLGWDTVPTLIREGLSVVDATALSLVENVHRADMNPRDKAKAFKALFDRYGSIQQVSRETGVGVQTIKKYLNLVDLAPELQEKLAAGEAKNTQALAQLAQRFDDPETQIETWERIGGFTQNVQQEIIRRVDDDLDTLDELVNQAAEGELGFQVVRNCPRDCRVIPDQIKGQVARMVEEFTVR
jgi:ParB family chromosome partitioning protein